MASRSKRRFLNLSPERWNEISGILLMAGGLFLLMSVASFHPDDLPFFSSRGPSQVQNFCGPVGALVGGLVRSGIGLTGYLLAGIGILWAFARFSGNPPQRFYVKAVSTLLFCLAAAALFSLVWVQSPEARVHRGGVLGLLVADGVVHYFGRAGAYVILLTVGGLGFLLVTELTVWPFIERAGKRLKPLLLSALNGAVEGAAGFWKALPALLKRTGSGTVTLTRRRPAAGEAAKPSAPAGKPPAPASRPAAPEEKPEIRREGPVVKVLGTGCAKPSVIPAQAGIRRGNDPRFRGGDVCETDSKSEPADVPAAPSAFELPPLDLLDKPAASGAAAQGKQELEQNAKVLEEALRDFGIEAKVAEVEMGPVITRYEVEPAPGVKVQKITTLADDLALVMKAPSVRIIAPIPGKARVGIEVPNPASALVNLREVLESEAFRDTSSRITLAIGKDTAGHPLVADLAQMPHLLIAGTTGSGKTICMNALITSILFNATPEEVRFIMVDPKMVELSVFNGIPHLMLPVLTNPKQVPMALSWVVQEMETRYRLFARLGVRNIEGYREKRASRQLPEEEVPDSLPYLVVIIDELADLMLVAQQEVERTIARLAHLSRAVGIHMVLATQRPSVDVLTGVIKANFPARISFQVASKVDSRTVLDAMGAEKLLGKGDLLFLQPGSSKLVRGQGTLVTDGEIERVVSFLKKQRAADYDTTILEAEEGRAHDPSAVKIKDPLYPEAVRVVVESGQASVSLLQRRMRLGYGRAARILDRMEEEGIVGPIRGAKPREVYLKDVPSELVDRRTSEVGA